MATELTGRLTTDAVEALGPDARDELLLRQYRWGQPVVSR
jgi:hypothetical protein